MSWTEAWMSAKEQKQKHINFRVHGHLFAFHWIRTKFKCPLFSDSFFKAWGLFFSERFMIGVILPQWKLATNQFTTTIILSKYIQHSRCKNELSIAHWLETKLSGCDIFQETEHYAVAQCMYTFISRYGKNKRTKKKRKDKDNKLNTPGTQCALATVYKL